MNSTDFTEYLEPCCQMARAAGGLIVSNPATPKTTHQKTDARTGRKSEGTLADDLANAHIVQKLQALTPHIPVIAEEEDAAVIAAKQRLIKSLFWLVDPLDGTKAFIAGKKDYTVNIALIQDGKPLFGVIYAPAEDLLYYNTPEGAFKITKGGAPEPIRVRPPENDGYVVVKSESHPSKKMQGYLDTLKTKQVLPMSGSLKFCKVAEGSAQVYPRLGNTMEWDTAAGHAILEAAGGKVLTEEGRPLTYNKPHFENPGFIASHGPVLRKTIISPVL